MTKIITLLTLTITLSMANSKDASTHLEQSNLDKSIKSEVITREVRTSREVRPARTIESSRKVQRETIGLSRVAREVRKERLAKAIIRVHRTVHYVQAKNPLHLASVK